MQYLFGPWSAFYTHPTPMHGLWIMFSAIVELQRIERAAVQEIKYIPIVILQINHKS
jgi:hypothetical protein